MTFLSMSRMNKWKVNNIPDKYPSNTRQRFDGYFFVKSRASKSVSNIFKSIENRLDNGVKW